MIKGRNTQFRLLSYGTRRAYWVAFKIRTPRAAEGRLKFAQLGSCGGSCREA